MTDRILVAGATGGVGAHIVRRLLSGGTSVRILVRDAEKARRLFPGAEGSGAIDIVVGDVRQPATLIPAVHGVTHVVCATGSSTPIGSNSPQHVDYEGVRNLVDAAKHEGVARFLLVSSMAVTKPNHFLNAFGQVLTWKLRGENHLRASGVPYTIVRPGGLQNAPGGRKGLIFDQGDRAQGMVSREDVGEVCLRALEREDTRDVTFEVMNSDGPAPGSGDWDHLFGALQPDAELADGN
jgi:uncharacterized protein YbjT (DUF2867 family)